MKGSLKKQLGNRVREYRKKASLTQADLAHKIGLSVNMIGYVERGERFPSPETFENLSKALGVTVFDLFSFPPTCCESDPEKNAYVIELHELINKMSTSSVRTVVNILSESSKLLEMEKMNNGART